MRICIMAIVALLTLAACGVTGDPVVAYPIDSDLAAVIQKNVNVNMVDNGFKPLKASEFETICNNFENSVWDFDETQRLQVEGGASLRSQTAHGEVLVWVWSATDPDDPVGMTPRLLKGFCQNT